MKTEKNFWKSKKWWAMMVGVSVPILNKVLGLDLSQAEVTMVITPIASYILGQGVADHGKNKPAS